eukprot:jgi/Psemu1/300407/fgenesh1_kg.11_\
MKFVSRRQKRGQSILLLAMVMLVLPALLQLLSVDDCFPAVAVTTEATTIVRKVRRRRQRIGVRTRNLSRSRSRALELPITGGYSPVANFEANAMVTEAAAFVLAEVRNPSSSHSIGLSSTQDASDIATARVVEASQQVVAGLNIRLTIAFEDDHGVCMGACAVVVYNHFGVLSITAWKEAKCKDFESRSGFQTADVKKAPGVVLSDEH